MQERGLRRERAELRLAFVLARTKPPCCGALAAFCFEIISVAIGASHFRECARNKDTRTARAWFASRKSTRMCPYVIDRQFFRVHFRSFETSISSIETLHFTKSIFPVKVRSSGPTFQEEST